MLPQRLRGEGAFSVHQPSPDYRGTHHSLQSDAQVGGELRTREKKQSYKLCCEHHAQCPAQNTECPYLVFMMNAVFFNLWRPDNKIHVLHIQSFIVQDSLNMQSLIPHTNFKFSLWVPNDQVGIIAGGQAALLPVQTTQLGCPLAQESHHVTELEVSPAG